jgi:hypothetical protein
MGSMRPLIIIIIIISLLFFLSFIKYFNLSASGHQFSGIEIDMGCLAVKTEFCRYPIIFKRVGDQFNASLFFFFFLVFLYIFLKDETSSVRVRGCSF